MCRQRWGPYTLRCNQYTATACNAPSLFVIPDAVNPKSWGTVAKRCSESHVYHGWSLNTSPSGMPLCTRDAQLLPFAVRTSRYARDMRLCTPPRRRSSQVQCCFPLVPCAWLCTPVAHARSDGSEPSCMVSADPKCGVETVGSTGYRKCLPGRHKSHAGYTHCIKCPAGTYSPNDGACRCDSCPHNYVLNAAQTSCGALLFPRAEVVWQRNKTKPCSLSCMWFGFDAVRPSHRRAATALMSKHRSCQPGTP